jgi:hypothetical protein
MTVAIVAIGPPDDPQRPGENLSITCRSTVPGDGGVNRPRSTAIAAVHADAAHAGTANGFIHNFSPGGPRDVVLG